MQLLRKAEIGFVVAPVEADPVLAHLCTLDVAASCLRYPRCIGIISDDSDFISFSVPGSLVEWIFYIASICSVT